METQSDINRIPNATIVVARNSSISEDMIMSAARLFSENYGTWSNGKRVKMSPSKLKEMLLPSFEGAQHFHVRALVDDELVGHDFATRWPFEGKQTCWVTQLVVRKDFRRKGYATAMLRKLRAGTDGPDWACGILSSHAGAVRAVLRTFGGLGLEDFSLDFTHIWACRVMPSCPIAYVRTAQVHEKVISDTKGDANASVAFTDFHVDHNEPEEALDIVRRDGLPWPFGRLPEGHEFLALTQLS